MACHDVGEVAEGLRRVAVRSDVDVNAAASCRVALCACLAKPSANLLQGFDVLVVEDRRDHLAFFIVRSGDRNVALEFPLASVRVPCAPGEVSVAAGGVFVAAGSEVLGGGLGGGFAGDVVHLDLNADCLVLKGFNLSGCFLCHGDFLLDFRGFPLPFACTYSL